MRATLQTISAAKYTLLVSKSKDANGYRTLYAAYEAEQDGYYNVITGTVDDGALVFEGKKQNVFFDKDCVFYVDEKVATKADFIAAYGKAQLGRLQAHRQRWRRLH